MINRSQIAMLVAILHLVMLPASVEARPQTSSTGGSLAGTSWQLVKFQSANDKTIIPDVKNKYTLSFGSEGRASIRLDCNRGSGSYESRGLNQLEFGRFALTLMMCPPGSLHNRIATDLGAVRSYIIKDGHLFLSLMADGGIYEFEPLGSPQSAPDELFGRKWKLTEIRGSAVNTTKPYIELVGETKRFSGDGGCNRVSGSFALNGESLRFLQIISTRRACIDPAMQQIETNFLKGLEDSFLYKLESDVLRLYAGDRLSLTFKADGNDAKQEGFVTGTVTYSQRRALPPNALVEVKLLDVSRAGAPSLTIAQQVIRSGGNQVPFAFELRYDPSRINERGRFRSLNLAV
jgi:heat shock protein HslJ